MARHNQIGHLGEQLACNFLEGLGYHVLATNWRWEQKEVDIICEHAGFLIFVEVKTRTSLRHGLPEESVNLQKQKFLIEAAEAYLEMMASEQEIRFDIVSVVDPFGEPQVYHIEEAFIPLLD